MSNFTYLIVSGCTAETWFARRKEIYLRRTSKRSGLFCFSGSLRLFFFQIFDTVRVIHPGHIVTLFACNVHCMLNVSFLSTFEGFFNFTSRNGGNDSTFLGVYFIKAIVSFPYNCVARIILC